MGIIPKTLVHACAGFIGLAMLAGPAFASSRVALVIGNSVYDHAPALSNPLNDAADVGAALGRIGFAVTRLENADYAAMRRALQEFRRSASAAETAVVFYAGHGIEVSKQNFLVPVDARLLTDGDVEFETVPLDLVMSAVEGASEFRLVVLDACRDNPFLATMKREHGSTRSIGRGLARAEPTGGGTLLAYSAKEGTLALDGKGRNSPYTSALLRYLEEPGLEVVLMFRKVRDAVLQSTGQSQEPFSYSSLSAQSVYLIPPAGKASMSGTTVAAGGSAAGLAVEVEYWKTVNAIADPAIRIAALLDYKAKFPGGVYADLADIQLKALRKRTDATTPEQAASSEAVETGLGLTREDRHRIQRVLAAQGFRPGRPDGLFGRRTRAAIRDWQAARRMKATGFLDADGVKALLASAAESKPEPERRGPAVGERFRDCANCPELVVVPSGSFMMGSSSGEVGRYADEGPVHRVSIAEPFAVGVNEVTFAQWDACRRGGGCTRNPDDWGWGRGRRPVMNVSWEEAQQYVRWLSRKTGKRYRLLTESEWEYVARARTRTARYWGQWEAGQCRHANGADRALERRSQGWKWATVACDDGHVQTAPVGSFSPNGFGLHDVLGNVWEWVEDCWHDGYTGAPGDGRAWTSGGDCSRRVLRGGSWNLEPRDLRSANRFRGTAGYRLNLVGFRVARTLD